MIQYVSNNPVGLYNTVAAGQTAFPFSNTQGNTTGAKGDYLEALIVSAGTTPGTFTLLDGATSVIVVSPAASTAVYIPIRAYSKSGAWNATTGTNVTAMAVGQFS